MEIKIKNPPNWKEIKKAFNPPQNAIYAYGDIIYNPSGAKISPDLMVHEQTHQKQQELLGDAEKWWIEYIKDPAFRMIQEIEAYGAQYLFLKEGVPNKILKIALFNMAQALSSIYGLSISHSEAESKIRNKFK